MDSEFLIQAEGVHVHYGASHVLHGVDLKVRPGETIGLMGRNGMGKTTLLKSLIGLLPPSAGRVRVRGTDMTGVAPHRFARAGLAYVPEGRGVFPNLSVRENLVMAARGGRQGKRDWTLERVLESFPRLGARLNHGGQQLSGGEQQMLTIGRALMTNPELLILDEATEGLAPLVAQDIWRILHTLRANSIATIVVDKSFSALANLADRIVILVKGQIAFDGGSSALREDASLRHRHLGV